MMQKENEIVMTTEEFVLCDKLRKMKFSAMSEKLKDLFQDPLTPNKTFETLVADLINCEWDHRIQKKFMRMLSQAHLKFNNAVFDDKTTLPNRNIDQALISRLCTCEWIPAAKVLIITGKTGTGKSYLACAFALLAIKKGYSTRFYAADTLLDTIEFADKNGNKMEFIEEMSSIDLLIIDDFGLMNLSFEKCSRLFSILDCRENKKATIVTSQLAVKDWYALFADSTYADACLDRLAKGSFRIPLEGPSLRPE